MPKNSHQKGFTLIEILVALFLVVLVVGLLAGNPFSTRDNLEKNLFEIERALRYAKDEATLRNAVVRLKINLEYPQSYVLEYGPNDNFVLPPDLYSQEYAVQTRAEDEERDERIEELDSKFHRVRAFQESEKEFLMGVQAIGGATGMTERLITENQFTIYVYPTGEMDSGIIILASDDEIGALSFESFIDQFTIDYVLLDRFNQHGELIDQQFEAAQRKYEDWVRE